jgi:hypothetical protein
MSNMQQPRRGRPRDEQIANYVAQILALKIDASVFVAGATSEELDFLRKPVKAAGAVIEIMQVERDEIYGVPGVRLFRREGTVDQL